MSTRRFVPLLGALAGAALLTLIGCGEGEATGATCPTDNTLTYQNFGKSFMDTYCLRCHNDALTGSARQGAPSDVNFNSVEQVREESKDIDKMAGASDTVTNTAMPEGSGEKPSVEDRKKLSQWLACGAP